MSAVHDDANGYALRPGSLVNRAHADDAHHGRVRVHAPLLRAYVRARGAQLDAARCQLPSVPRRSGAVK